MPTISFFIVELQHGGTRPTSISVVEPIARKLRGHQARKFGIQLISHDALAGYLLEELLASLIQSAGYRLLVHESQDPAELNTTRSGDLQVKGRGGVHQVDVLGEFTIVPAFSQPLRLFVEAKARGGKTGISVVRNALGTISDVNEAWMIDYSTNRARRHYRYALFSTSGFSEPAQKYAIAHQISLVDLSGPEWNGLRGAVDTTARELLDGVQAGAGRFPVRMLRQLLRDELGTAPDAAPRVEVTEDVLRSFGLPEQVRRLHRRLDEAVGGALLAFPAGQQVLLVRPDNLAAFLERAERQPEHRVTLTLADERPAVAARTWVIRPLHGDGTPYAMRVSLPAAVEARALAESDRRARSLTAKGDLGGRLDILWDPRGADSARLPGPRLFRLVFAGSDLLERRRFM